MYMHAHRIYFQLLQMIFLLEKEKPEKSNIPGVT